jgi:ABC-type maltose transport system permease subunit
LSIVTLNFSVVMTYIIVHSFCRQRFNFRTYFHSHFWLFRMHAHMARFRALILNCVQCSGRRVVCCLVRVLLLLRSYNGEKKI